MFCSSQPHGVVGGEQAALPPQTPFPPRRVGAVQQLDDVAGAEAQLVVLLRAEVVQRLRLLRGGRPLLDGGSAAVKYVVDDSVVFQRRIWS